MSFFHTLFRTRHFIIASSVFVMSSFKLEWVWIFTVLSTVFISTSMGRGVPLGQIRRESDVVAVAQIPPARSGRQFDYDTDEDYEDEETTVKGPGHEGILKGLSGIFSNIVSGNANGIVESSFNFVAPAYQKRVSSAYDTIVGRTTSTPKPVPTTTPQIIPPGPPGNEVSGILEEGGLGHIQAEAGIRTRPRPNPQFLPISSGDDEEDDRRAGLIRQPPGPQKYQILRPKGSQGTN